MRRTDLRISIAGKTELTGDLEMAAFVCLPEPDRLRDRPAVAFCWPGGGYSRDYYDMTVSGMSGYSQAEHHASQGIITVGCDHIGVGASSEPDRSQLTYENVAAANRAVVDAVLGMLADGSLDPEFPRISDPVLIGMGQSYGGLLLIVQQARQWTFDGIAVLGYTAQGLSLPRPLPGGTSDTGGRILPPTEMTDREVMTYFFHWENVPDEIIAQDMKGEHPTREQPLPMWASDRRPGGRHWSPAPPEVIEHWADIIECPVFLGLGERDVSPDPYQESSRFRRCKDFTLFVGPHMGHMHNFAGSRERLWERLENWIDGIVPNPFAPGHSTRIRDADSLRVANRSPSTTSVAVHR